MKHGTKPPIWLYAAILLTACFALIALSYRFRVEQKNKAAGLAIEFQAARDAAAGEKTRIEDFLSEAKRHGLFAVCLSEELFTELVQSGRLRFTGRNIVEGSPADLEQLAVGLRSRFGQESFLKSEGHIEIFVAPEELATLSVGINTEDAKAARNAGLVVIARHGNAPGAKPDYVRSMLSRSRKLGATIYLPEGDQVLGQRTLVNETALTLAKLGMSYAAPEFVKISGDATLAKKSEQRLIRLHSIQAVEADRMAPAEIRERFARAFRERNIRLLLLRPLSLASDSPTQSLLNAIDLVKNGVESEGGRASQPRPFLDPQVPAVLLVLLSLAVGVVSFWVGTSLVSSVPFRVAGAAVILGLVIASFTPIARLYLATLAAMAFPIAAYLVVLSKERVKVFNDYLSMSAISIVGGLAVAGLLSELPYMVRNEQFFAVKLAHFAPILILAVLLLKRWSLLATVGHSSVTWIAAGVSALILGGMVFMFARTGNDNPAAVSDIELRLRNVLDTILFARPRTKEFLIGNPALWLGLSCLARARVLDPSRALQGWAVLFLTIGAIGQTSMVNTFCHIHSPLDLSVSRVVMGLLLGGIIGALLWAALRSNWRPHPIVES